jgi:hypothetical protein
MSLIIEGGITIGGGISYADAQNVYGWVFSSHAYNIWTSESGRVVNFNTGANVGTANSNNFNFLVCKTPA